MTLMSNAEENKITAVPPDIVALDGVHQLTELAERREQVFLVLAGLFIGSMAMLNIVSITRFVAIGPLAIPVGVLAYPLTFLCTDLISEFYGRKRANSVVTVGLVINGLVLSTLWLGNALPSVDLSLQPPWQSLHLAQPTALPNGSVLTGEVQLFHLIYACTRGSVIASMAAYLLAQYCDVYLFHFWKKFTKGKHLWLRNNGSTLVSQLVDTVAVIAITFGPLYLRGQMDMMTVVGLVGDSYMFKAAMALLDTLPFYLAVRWMMGYLKIDPTQAHAADG